MAQIEVNKEEMPDLDSLYSVMSEEDIKELLKTKDEDGEDLYDAKEIFDDKKHSKKHHKEEDEDDEDDEEDEEEDDEDEDEEEEDKD